MRKVPPVAVIHDLSGVGRCALSVAMPVLSLLGCQVCALPTALLSAHTAFPGVIPQDESRYLAQALEEWYHMERTFDGVYTGYLADPWQADLLAHFLAGSKQKDLAFSLVDPAMGDHGKLYRAVSPQMPQAMRKLCARARLIVPNPTEAALLTGRPYQDTFVPGEVCDLVKSLLSLSCQGVLITGLRLPDGRCANLYAPSGSPGFWICPYQPLPAAFPGTGDLFASTLTGFVMGGKTVQQAMGLATAFVYMAMESTLKAGSQPREGVIFEPLLGQLPHIAPIPTHFVRTDSPSFDREQWTV